MSVALLLKIRIAVSWTSLIVMRTLERCCSPAVLERLVRPLSLWRSHAARDLRERLERDLRKHSDCLPTPSAQAIEHALASHDSARFLTMWGDRLNQRCWLDRCHVDGFEHWQEATSQNRPVVFVSLHFDAYQLLGHWIRAHGIPTALLVADTAPQRNAYRKFKHRLVPPRDVEFVFGPDRLANMVRSLETGRPLLVMADFNSGRQVIVRFGSCFFRFATGGIRMAASAGARLIPCLALAHERWKFTLRFYPPVPDKLLSSRPDLQLVADHLLQVFLPEILRRPEACGADLLNSISSTPPPPATFQR